jgi:hypothetical protein
MFSSRFATKPLPAKLKPYNPPIDFGELQRLNMKLHKGAYKQRITPEHLQCMTGEVGWLLGVMYDQYLALKSFTFPGVEESVSNPMKLKLKSFLNDTLDGVALYMPKAITRQAHYVLCAKLAEEAAVLGEMWKEKVAHHTLSHAPYPETVNQEGYMEAQNKVNENEELEHLYVAQGKAVLLAWDTSLTFDTMRDTLKALKENLKGVKYNKLTATESVEVDAAIAHAQTLENDLIPTQQETLKVYLKTVQDISTKVKNLERHLYGKELGKHLISVASEAEGQNLVGKANITLEELKASSELKYGQDFFTKIDSQNYIDTITFTETQD